MISMVLPVTFPPLPPFDEEELEPEALEVIAV